MARTSIGIGLMGLGVVGTGVARVLLQKAEGLTAQVGCPLHLQKVLVRDIGKKRSVNVDPSLLTLNPRDVLHNPDIDIIVEVMGGENPAHAHVTEALKSNKNVATANKEVIAKHGPELLALAQQHRVGIRYEASVGGGIPIIAPLQQDLAANTITSIRAIINGTTNYILTRMATEGLDFSVALKRAQELGYAEPDPTNDIEGIDAAYKLAVMATLAFRSVVRFANVSHEGISRLARRDFLYASELGYAIKLLAIAREKDNVLEARVHPVFISQDSLMAKVGGAYNAIQLEGDLVGDLVFYGRGAGAAPTSSAVLADVITLAKNLYSGRGNRPAFLPEQTKAIKDISQVETRYYLRMNVADRPGVLARIAKTLGDHNISISAVIQEEADPLAQTAEIVIMTHPALEAAMQQASKELQTLDMVREINNIIRVET